MRRHFRNMLLQTRALFLLLMFSASPAWSQDEWVAPAWTSVSVGVADLDQALGLWVDTFGFSMLAEADGEDPELAKLWRLLPSDIKRQALLGMPGSAFGKLHLVEFSEPGPPVREGAQSHDLSPVNLVVYVEGLSARVEALKADGRTFRNAEPIEYIKPDGSKRSEIHLLAHDEINIVLREQAVDGMNYSPQSFSGIVAVASIIDFSDKEAEFYSGVMGLDPLDEIQLAGAEIAAMLGVGEGVTADLISLGQTGQRLGQIELIDYQGAGVRSKDLYSITVPSQLGILHVSYAVADLDAFKARLHTAGINHSDRDYREVIFSSGRFIRFRSPAGMNIEAFKGDGAN